MYLERVDVEEIGKKFNLDVVPIIGEGTLDDAIDLCKYSFASQWGDFQAEGLVLRPNVELLTRRAERIITKVKYCDFNK